MRRPPAVAAPVVALVGVVAGCGASVRGPQLDMVLRTQVGTGAATTAAAHLPHARYTFFAWEDPTLCLAGVALLDADGKVRGASRSTVPRRPRTSPSAGTAGRPRRRVPAPCRNGGPSLHLDGRGGAQLDVEPAAASGGRTGAAGAELRRLRQQRGAGHVLRPRDRSVQPELHGHAATWLHLPLQPQPQDP